MSNRMTIRGQDAPVGMFAITFRRFSDERPPYSWVDLMPEHEDDSLGGIALNCLDIGDVESVNALEGREFSFGEGSGTEIRESVLWEPNRQMLEIEALQIKFGRVVGGQVSFELRADCFDHHGEAGIPVVVSGSARLVANGA